MSEESNKCDYNKIKDYKSAFECFKQRFLIEKKSIFRLSSDDEILNSNSIQYLMDHFVNKGLEGEVSFIDKIKLQLLVENEINSTELKLGLIYPKNIKDNDKQSIQKNAIEVLAHCVWLWRLVPYNAKMESTKQSIKEILELHENLKKINFDSNNFFDESIKGIASTGTYYNTNKPIELAFIIKFLNVYLNSEDNKNEIEILNSFCKKAEIKTFGNIIKKGNQLEIEEAKIKKEAKKTASIANALLFFFDPDNYEPIVSNEHKEAIVKALDYLIQDDDCKKNIDQQKNNEEVCKEEEIDNKLKCIKDKLTNDDKYKKYKDSIGFFYEESVQELWNPTILPGKNVIYYGAPGTGKTYNIKKIVENKAILQCEDSNDYPENYYEIVQFHPSYSYEDFIDGVKPVGISSSGQMQFELKNGIFKQMCIDAFKELIKAKEKDREPIKFYFIADEINRAELSRVFGELLLCLEEDKRLKIKKDENKLTVDGTKIKTANSMLWKQEHAVVIVKKNTNEVVTELNDNEEYEFYFGVPENIYFIGTMNDVDRSVDSFDLALRRRFLWKRMDCDYEVILDSLSDYSNIGEIVTNNKYTGYLKACYDLNQYITTNKKFKIKNKKDGVSGLDLGITYEIGHAYFLKIDSFIGKQTNKIKNEHLKKLFEFSIEPLLREYLRTNYDEKQIEDKLNEAKNVFSLNTESIDDEGSDDN